MKQNKLFMLSVDEIKEIILSFGIFAPAVYMIFMIIAVVVSPIPSSFLVVFAAVFFGWFAGMVYSLIGATIGALVAFYIGRGIGEIAVKRLVGERKYKKLMDKIPENIEAKAVFLLRIPPSPTFDIVSYLAGLTKISWWKFALATFLGMMPVVFSLSYFGESVLVSKEYFLIGMVVLFLILFVPYFFKKK